MFLRANAVVLFSWCLTVLFCMVFFSTIDVKVTVARLSPASVLRIDSNKVKVRNEPGDFRSLSEYDQEEEPPHHEPSAEALAAVVEDGEDREDKERLENDSRPKDAPMYDPTLFEGDIVPTWDYIVQNYSLELAEELVAKGILVPKSKDALDSPVIYGTEPTRKLWRNYMVNDIFVIPVFIPDTYITADKAAIKDALNKLAAASKVISFDWITSRYTNGTPFIEFKNADGCSSYVGRDGELSYLKEGQIITLEGSQGGGGHCIWSSTIQHEMMHALGFRHEQSRPDRNDYVDIVLENVQTGTEHNFVIQSTVDSLGSAYDYNSIMHYSTKAFSSNGQDTIVPKNGTTIVDSDYATASDLQQLQLMYQCKSGPRTLAAFQANRCTEDCKCWLGARGCKGINAGCKGNLVCKRNKCVKGTGPAPPQPKTIVKYFPFNSYYPFDGVVFDVKAKRKIKITDLVLSLRTTGPVTMEIFTKSGSGAGFETNEGSWTLMKSFTYKGDGTMYPEPIRAPLFQPVLMRRGTTRSFLVTVTSSDSNYFRTTKGTSYGIGNFISNSHIIVKEGCGVNYPFDYVWCVKGSTSYSAQGGVEYVLA